MKTNLDELQSFIAIIDTGSLTAAAALSNQTTSGLSRTLSRLEKKLGCTLLRRTTRKLDLTAEGETFLEQARKIIDSLEQAEDSVKQKNIAPSGILKIDSASPFILHAIVPYLKEFNDLYPDIEIELHSSEHIIDLLEKRIDIAIRIGKLEDSTLHATPLPFSQRRIFASPEYLKKHGTPKTIAELSAHTLLGFATIRELNDWPLKATGGVYRVNPKIRVTSGETLLQLTRSGAGIACLSDFMTKADRQSGSLVQILKNCTLENTQPIHAVYYKNTQHSQRAVLFTQFLKKKLKVLVS